MTRDSASDTKKHLLDIMMAQDFQDLTGQVITKVTKLGHSMESQLVQLLIEHAPAAMALFDRESGTCISGAAEGTALTPVALTVDGQGRLAIA